MTTAAGSPATFILPVGLLATAPPEARGLTRDGVRLMVASAAGIEHRTAWALPAVLQAGDLLVLNTSETLPAALRGVGPDGAVVEMHLSTVDPAAGVGYPLALAGTRSRWVVEVREPGGYGGTASYADRTGAELRLTGGGRLRIDRSVPAGRTTSRLWAGELVTPAPLLAWLREHGDPIRYGYVSAPWPLSAYRNSYADTPGSVELPSAGRALTPRLLRRLRARGVQVASLVLHCGVSSLESGDPPYREWFELPESTAAAVRAARAEGRRVIAVGSTVVRALESAAAPGGGEVGVVRATAGWTDLVVGPGHHVSTVDGLLTGWHEPAATHQTMLQAVAGTDLVRASYAAALAAGYRWHEFGDLHLLLPVRG